MSDTDDVMKNAGRWFEKLGETVKETSKMVGAAVVQTTKQVTGLGRGGVRLELDQARAAPGGTLAGRLVLTLTEAVDAKRLVVSLRARQRILTFGERGSSVASSHAPVYHFDCELDTAHSYDSRTVPFELTVPPDALELRASAKGDNPLSDVVRTVASALSPTQGPIEWQVIGKLEIPWGRDLASEVDVVITR